MSWVFAGSREMEGGVFAADVTGYVVSVVNFDLTLIDIPEVASNSNDLLEWERNPDVAPPDGAKVVMVIEPAGDAAKGKRPAEGDGAKPDGAAPKAELRGTVFEKTTGTAAHGGLNVDSGEALSDVSLDERRMKALRERWTRAVRPHGDALREAAQAHYEVIDAMRREQQRLIDEADRIQRAIDSLEKEYQDFTTPRPAPTEAGPERTAESSAPAPSPAPH